MQKNEIIGKVNGFIDRDTEMTGDIKFSDSFRIDGTFKGKILSGNTLIVGEGGMVEADVDVANISINGVVKGTLKASERVEIYSLGRVTGEIITPKLIVEEGAFFQGSCQMELKVLESRSKVMEEKPDKDQKN
ncbi:MAG: polymer-forming cytoskeletal protein [Candidatus Aminicenantes bacterium]|nr:polymer-forming cytoskeletal protein [Candidatus Aminicenantes bacterium]